MTYIFIALYSGSIILSVVATIIIVRLMRNGQVTVSGENVSIKWSERHDETSRITTVSKPPPKGPGYRGVINAGGGGAGSVDGVSRIVYKYGPDYQPPMICKNITVDDVPRYSDNDNGTNTGLCVKNHLFKDKFVPLDVYGYSIIDDLDKTNAVYDIRITAVTIGGTVVPLLGNGITVEFTSHASPVNTILNFTARDGTIINDEISGSISFTKGKATITSANGQIDGIIVSGYPRMLIWKCPTCVEEEYCMGTIACHENQYWRSLIARNRSMPNRTNQNWALLDGWETDV